jgi:hypothetical protein
MTDFSPDSIVVDLYKGIKVDAGLIAEPFRNEIKEKVKALKAHGIGAIAAAV